MRIYRLRSVSVRTATRRQQGGGGECVWSRCWGPIRLQKRGSSVHLHHDPPTSHTLGCCYCSPTDPCHPAILPSHLILAGRQLGCQNKTTVRYSTYVHTRCINFNMERQKMAHVTIPRVTETVGWLPWPASRVAVALLHETRTREW